MVAFDSLYAHEKRNIMKQKFHIGFMTQIQRFRILDFFENLPEYFHIDCYERLCPLFNNIINAFRENRTIQNNYKV